MRSPSLTGGRRLAASTLMAASLALAGAAGADEVRGAGGGTAGSSDGTVVERLLDIMLQQKTITRSQYDELLSQARSEEAAAAARMAEAAKQAETAPAAAEQPEWDFGWDNGFTLERSDGSAELEFGGRIHADGAIINESDGLDDDLKALGGNGQGNGVEVRRARIFFKGTVYERLFFKAQYEFAGGEASFKDLYMGVKGLGPVGRIQVGQFKEPYFLDEQSSSNDMTFMERGLNTVFYPDRNVGISAMNTAAEKRFRWQVGVYRDTDDVGDAFSNFNRTDWDTALRLTGLPIWEENGSHFLHLGAAYIHRFRGDSERYRQRPETHLADRFVDTGNMNTRGTDLFGAELAWINGPLAIQSEYTHALVNRNEGGSNVDFWGAYGQVSYFLTGEHLVYKPDDAYFGRVRPKANLNPARGEWGAWQLAARFSYLDLNDSDVRGGQIWDASAGLNWYLFPNARVLVNYVHSHLSGRRAPAPAFNMGGTADIIETRFMVDF